MGSVAPIVMSLIVFSGAAQFAALTVLIAGGGVVPAVAAAMMMNGRWLPMGLAVGPYLKGRTWRRSLESLALVDASFALSRRDDGTFDREIMIGSTIPQYLAWSAGTAAGVLGGAVLSDPQALGLDAMFPAFFAVLLYGEARTPDTITAAALGGLIALALMPFAPPGVPVLAAAAAALLGLRRTRTRTRLAEATA
jgi:4-azaleucine resistance transporter AzlC